MWFEPELVYGFEFLTSRLDLTAYKVAMGISVDMGLSLRTCRRGSQSPTLRRTQLSALAAWAAPDSRHMLHLQLSRL